MLGTARLKKRIRHNSDPLLSSGHENFLGPIINLRLSSAAAAASTEKFDVSPKTFCEVEEMIMDLSIRIESADLFHALI